MSTSETTDRFVTDAVGQIHAAERGPFRIVSLVPSITELLFDLGLGASVVGRTSYCVHPASEVASIPSVGGTKKIKIRCLAALRPTHVVVNVDENRQEMAATISALGARVVVTHPLVPEDNRMLFHLLGTLFDRGSEAERLTQRFQESLDRVREGAADFPNRRVLYLIWRDPWMTVSRETYISGMLRLIGWDTVPASSASRYPTVEAAEAHRERVDLVAFSSEPYAFGRGDMEEFTREFGIPMERMVAVDGELISWYGSRAARGLDYLLEVAERV